MQKILKRFFVLVCVLLIFILSAHATSYTQLEYIESTGTQYIDTDIYSDKNTELELVAKTNDAANWGFLYGADVKNSNQSYHLGQTGVDYTLVFDFIAADGQHRIKSSVLGADAFHKIEIKDKSFIVDGITFGSFASENNFTPTYSSYLFRLNGQETQPDRIDQGSSVKYLKIWQSGTLVRNFVPAKRKHDGVLGMYDLVNNKFYINSGTGTFIAGPAVCAATVTILGAQFCLTENQPSGSYLTARYNNNKYYINLSVENDALNPKAITSESNNVLRIKVGNTTYNAHDTSVE